MQNNKQFDFSSFISFLKNSERSEKQQVAEKMKSSLSEEDGKKLNEILNDTGKIDAILKSAAAQRIIEKINGNGNGKYK